MSIEKEAARGICHGLRHLSPTPELRASGVCPRLTAAGMTHEELLSAAHAIEHTPLRDAAQKLLTERKPTQ